MKTKFYEESPDAGNDFRADMLKEVRELIRRKRRDADRRRRRHFATDFSSVAAYEESSGIYREELNRMLGWPLSKARPSGTPGATNRFVARDSLGDIFRVRIETLCGVQTA